MTVKERIQAEIANVPEEKLEELYAVIRRFVEDRSREQTEGLMQGLKRIRIQGPADFSTNLDLYLSGEKRVEDDLH